MNGGCQLDTLLFEGSAIDADIEPGKRQVPILDSKPSITKGIEVLGATRAQYWWMVAFPILFPSLLGTFALLFANSFGAVATAFALTGPQLNIVPPTIDVTRIVSGTGLSVSGMGQTSIPPGLPTYVPVAGS